MGRKIFVSYKYKDNNVRTIYRNGIFPVYTTARNYVDILEEKLGKENIYKGENDGEDMSSLSDPTIWNKLKERIFDSTITVVLISPNMKDIHISEDKQWIPQEISYSLKNITHEGRTSGTNGLVCVILPDRMGSYAYYITKTFYGIEYIDRVTFDIIKNNRNNKISGKGDFIVTTKWDDFIRNYNYYIEVAANHKDNIEDYNVTKTI